MKNFFLGVLITSVALIGGVFVGASFHSAAPVAVQSGAVSSPDIQSPYINVNGVQYFSYGIQMKKASTTCSFKSPAATSSIALLQWKIASSSSSATIVETGTASTAFATTTLLGTTYNVAAGAQASVFASTTPSTGRVIVGPNTFVNIKIGPSGSNYPVGTCDAEFDVI